MTRTPAISICMASYNGAEFIHAQIASILDQLGASDELVISDDGSSDATEQISETFADTRMRLLKNTGQKGPVSNFENALRHARHDVLVLADQDDLWLPNKLAEVRSRFAHPPHPVFVVVFDATVIDASGAVIYPSLLEHLQAGPGLLRNLYANTFVGCCMAFSRGALELALPIPRQVSMHDVWIGMLALVFGRVEFATVKTMQYRRHGANATSLRREFKPLRQVVRRVALGVLLSQRVWARRNQLRQRAG